MAGNKKVNSIFQHKREIRDYALWALQVPDISPKEDTYLLVSEAQAGNADARNILYLAYMKYVFYIVSHYYSFKDYMEGEIEDCVQEGMLGLYEAIMRFDVTKNASFTTYLTIWVRKYVSRYLSEDGTITRSSRIVKKTQQLQSACMDYELLHGRRPTITELAEIIGESENVTRNLLEALQRARIKSLDHPRNDDEKWTEQLKYDYDLESEVCQEVMNREFENMVIEVLQNETDRQIIDYVFEYADNDMTRSEIAESVGVSKQYICKRIIAIKELLRTKHII